MERIRGYRYRAYPNKAQREFFEKTFGCCRFVYNHYLEAKKNLWKEWRDTLSYSEMSRDLSKNLKKEKVWLKEADSIALQQSLRHLDKAYQNFFKNRCGYPQLRKKHAKQSYRTMNVNGNIQIDGDTIKLPKAGSVKIVNTRDFKGRIINATVSRTPSGRYYISLQVEEEYEVLPNEGGMTGIDVGLKTLCTDDSGGMVQNPRTLALHEKRIKRLQRSLSRKKKGSKNRNKARIKLAREHEKMADRGGILIKVPRTYPSSQRCSCCGRQNRKVRDLSIRSWTCPACGTQHDRDMNAAVNILAKGLEMLAS